VQVEQRVEQEGGVGAHALQVPASMM
jgi:hypothetical protein